MLSISLWFFFSLVIGALPNKYSEGSPYRIVDGFVQTFGNSISWWAVAIIGIFIAVGINLAATALQRVFFPTDRNLWQEIEQQKVEGEGEGEGTGDVEEGPMENDLPSSATTTTDARKPHDV